MATIDHHHGDEDSADDHPSGRGLTVHVRSATKDSLAVVWRGAGDYDQQSASSSAIISGYKVRYQAVGSTVVQYSHLLQVRPSTCSLGHFAFYSSKHSIRAARKTHNYTVDTIVIVAIDVKKRFFTLFFCFCHVFTFLAFFTLPFFYFVFIFFV